ncbi:hypothetical protein ACFFU1_16620 [Algibacter miyuki]|uniref:Auto-transporter adhesin head GIN domain-containing protein n=1 Tax=Algibacter miyuki TaxID=1306933 RepID=A0ABV5H3T0_9FLAO|nr:hypothetical protein [Algibacter miyuki]MDN3665603.1 hypothetical protein [Algibacter miyuki]
MKLFKIPAIIILIMILSCSSETFTSKKGEQIEVSTLIGRNIFTIQNSFTTVGFETLSGTDGEIWVTYSKEMDVTLVSKKSKNNIIIAEKGRHPRN